MNPTVATKARSLNNAGIHYLSQGNYEEALKTICSALTLVKQVMAYHQPEPSMDVADDKTTDADSPTCLFFPLQEKASSFADCKHAVVRDQTQFTFSNPIFLPADSAKSATTFKYYVSLSFILMFNLALTHHLCAMEGETPCQAKLQKALSLYELAYTIHMTEGLEISVLQTMAIVNNLGQIHTILGSKDKARQCFEHLLSTIMFLNNCRETGAADTDMNDCGVDGFVGNVLSLILNTPLSAPAA